MSGILSEFYKKCELCGHSLEDNMHGFDQADADMEGDTLVHSGRCTYCRVCNPQQSTADKESDAP